MSRAVYLKGFYLKSYLIGIFNVIHFGTNLKGLTY